MTNLPSNHGLRALARGAALLAAVLTTAAGAQNASQIQVDAAKANITQVRAVATRDLDLSTDHGRRALDQRIRIAAARVCDVWDISETRSQADYTRCFTTALAGGRAQAAERSAQRDGAPIRVSAG